MSKIQTFNYHICKVNTSMFLVLISTNINQNLSKATNEIFKNALVFPFPHQTLKDCLFEGWFKPVFYKQSAPPNLFFSFSEHPNFDNIFLSI